MSTQTVLPDWAVPGAAAQSTPTRPGLVLLTRLELRKMADTRAGRWLLGITALIVIVVIGGVAIWGDGQTTWSGYSMLAYLPVGIFGPVLGIMTVTSEWSQRTALTTFTLVPARGWIVVAKTLAAMILSFLTMVVILPVSAVFAALSDAPGRWDLDAATLGQMLLFLIINFGIGVGFGLLFASTPVAIVSFFALPIAFSLLSQISALRTAGEWLDINSTLGVLGAGEGITGQEWAKILTSTLLWMGLPMLVGAVRTLRREVK